MTALVMLYASQMTSVCLLLGSLRKDVVTDAYISFHGAATSGLPFFDIGASAIPAGNWKLFRYSNTHMLEKMMVIFYNTVRFYSCFGI
jgi:hypothetical protein